MFQYEQGGSNCKLRSQRQRKFTNIYELLVPETGSPAKDVWLLQCSPVSENILDNSDFFTGTRERKYIMVEIKWFIMLAQHGS